MSRSIRWNDLSDTQKFIFGFLGAVQLILFISAVWDIRRRSPEEINGTKRLWTALSFINIIGPASYFLFGRKASW